MNNEKRKLTKRQAEALRLCHHDFEGSTQKEAAKIMGITQQAISLLLIGAEKVAPQMFPIITKLELKIYNLYQNDGYEVFEIVEYMDMYKNTKVSEEAVYETLRRVKEKGLPFTGNKGRLLSLDQLIECYGESYINSIIKHKF